MYFKQYINLNWIWGMNCEFEMLILHIIYLFFFILKYPIVIVLRYSFVEKENSQNRFSTTHIIYSDRERIWRTVGYVIIPDDWRSEAANPVPVRVLREPMTVWNSLFAEVVTSVSTLLVVTTRFAQMFTFTATNMYRTHFGRCSLLTWIHFI